MADKLKIYNRALSHLKEERLASLTERRSPRFKLDDVWDDAVAYCLQRGYWRFATRTQEIFASTSVDPPFGYKYAFQIPDDLARIIQVATDDKFNGLLQDYREESGFWYADFDTLYVRFVSNDSLYGGDMGKWPQSFIELMALRLAAQTALTITNDKDLAAFLRKEERTYRIDAQSIDAMGDPPQRPPIGSWIRSRRGMFFTGPGINGGGTSS